MDADGTDDVYKGNLGRLNVAIMLFIGISNNSTHLNLKGR